MKTKRPPKLDVLHKIKAPISYFIPSQRERKIQRFEPYPSANILSQQKAENNISLTSKKMNGCCSVGCSSKIQNLEERIKSLEKKIAEITSNPGNGCCSTACASKMCYLEEQMEKLEEIVASVEDKPQYSMEMLKHIQELEQGDTDEDEDEAFKLAMKKGFLHRRS